MLRRMIVLTALVGLLVAGFATQASAWPAGTGTVTGTMVDKVTGEPVIDVRWVLYSFDEAKNMWTPESQGGSQARGRFEAYSYNVAARSQAILVVSGEDKYQDYVYRGISPAVIINDFISPLDKPNTGDYARATRIQLVPDGVVSLGNLQVTKILNTNTDYYGMIKGVVRDSYSGVGIAPCTVVAYGMGAEWVELARTQTADDGSYVLAGTKAVPLTREIRLGFFPSGADRRTAYYYNSGDVTTARSLFIRPDTTVTGVDQQIVTPGRLTGTVIAAETKKPIFDAKLYAYVWRSVANTWESQGVTTHTNSNGNYALPSARKMAAGSYRIEVFDWFGSYGQLFYGQASTVEDATTVVLGDDEIVTGLDIYMSTHPAIAGRVLDDSDVSLPDILVEVLRRGTDGSWVTVGSDYTDSFGRYGIVVPAAGTYTVRYTDQGGTLDATDDVVHYPGGASDAGNAEPVQVRASTAAVVPPIHLTPVQDARATRAWGLDRYQTAIAASRSAFAAGESTCAVLATGESFPDALSAAGLAGAINGPVLLTRSGSLYMALLDEFDRLGVEKVYLLGGPAAISAQQEALISALGYEVERIGGADRYATSVAVAREVAQQSVVTSDTPVFVTSGANYPDALCVAPVAWATDGIVLLVNPRGVSSATKAAVTALSLKKGYAVGGSNVIPATVLSQLGGAGMHVERIAAGTNRYETAVQFAQASRSRGWVSADAIGIAIGTGFADALGAGSAVGHAGGYVLLTEGKVLTPCTGSEIGRRSADLSSITVFGSPVAIGSRVLVDAGSR